MMVVIIACQIYTSSKQDTTPYTHKHTLHMENMCALSDSVCCAEDLFSIKHKSFSKSVNPKLVGLGGIFMSDI